MALAVRRIRSMGLYSIKDLERLLSTLRFEPPATLRPGAPELDFPPRRPTGQLLAVGAAAVSCVVLLIFVFLTALLGLKGQ